VSQNGSSLAVGAEIDSALPFKMRDNMLQESQDIARRLPRFEMDSMRY
jgi:hypothetical protein